MNPPLSPEEKKLLSLPLRQASIHLRAKLFNSVEDDPGWSWFGFAKWSMPALAVFVIFGLCSSPLPENPEISRPIMVAATNEGIRSLGATGLSLSRRNEVPTSTLARTNYSRSETGF